MLHFAYFDFGHLRIYLLFESTRSRKLCLWRRKRYRWGRKMKSLRRTRSRMHFLGSLLSRSWWPLTRACRCIDFENQSLWLRLRRFPMHGWSKLEPGSARRCRLGQSWRWELTLRILDRRKSLWRLDISASMAKLSLTASDVSSARWVDRAPIRNPFFSSQRM